MLLSLSMCLCDVTVVQSNWTSKKKIVIDCKWHFDSSILLLPFQVKSVCLWETCCFWNLSAWLIWVTELLFLCYLIVTKYKMSTHFFMCSRKSVLFISKVKRVQQQRCHVGGGNNSWFLIMDLAAVYEAILVICCCLPVVLFFSSYLVQFLLFLIFLSLSIILLLFCFVLWHFGLLRLKTRPPCSVGSVL